MEKEEVKSPEKDDSESDESDESDEDNERNGRVRGRGAKNPVKSKN